MLPLSLFKTVPFTNGSITLFLLGLHMMSGTCLSRLTSALGILLLCISCYLNSSLTQNSSNIDIILRLIVAGSVTGLSMATRYTFCIIQ